MLMMISSFIKARQSHPVVGWVFGYGNRDVVPERLSTWDKAPNAALPTRASFSLLGIIATPGQTAIIFLLLLVAKKRDCTNETRTQKNPYDERLSQWKRCVFPGALMAAPALFGEHNTEQHTDRQTHRERSTRPSPSPSP
uniref:Uncharacterized protein n=1 Tax=Anopheles farauti TaxID=69004 RepID=A0A182Q471_9DIPT